MLENLLKEVEGNIVLLDTSVLSPNEDKDLYQILYTGLSGLRSIDQAPIAQRGEILDELQDFSLKNQLIVLPEVRREIEKGLEEINMHLRYFKDKKRIRTIARKVRKEVDDEFQGDALKDLQRLSHQLYNFTRVIHDVSLGVSFSGDSDSNYKRLNNLFLQEVRHFISTLSPPQKDLYLKLLSDNEGEGQAKPGDYKGKTELNFERYYSLLNIAMNNSVKMKQHSLDKAAKNKTPCGLGLILNTDLRIVATALEVSYTSPVYILTRDCGIEQLVRVLGGKFEIEEVQSRYGLTKPRCAPIVLNPDRHNPSRPAIAAVAAGAQ